MIHMGLQLLTVALESAPIANCQSLLGLVKEELCRHLFQVSLACASMACGTGESDTNLHQRVSWNSVFWGLAGLSLQITLIAMQQRASELHQQNSAVAKPERLWCAIFFRPGPRRMKVIWMNCYCGITLCFDIIGFEVITNASYQLSSRQNLWSAKLLIAQGPSQREVLSQVPSPLTGSVDLAKEQICCRKSVTASRRELSCIHPD